MATISAMTPATSPPNEKHVTVFQTTSSPQIEQQLRATGVAQVIVVLKSAMSQDRSTTLRASETASLSARGLEQYFQSSELSQKTALMRMQSRTKKVARMAASLKGTTSTRPPDVQYFRNLGVMLGIVNREGLDGLAKDDRVAAVTGAPQFSLIWPQRVAPAKLTRDTTWGVEYLSVPRLWDQGLSGKDVRVAHLDTGVDGRHPALKNAVTAFTKLDDFGVQVSPSPDPFDSDEHGTHTAGTIAGREVRGKRIGVAPGAELCSAMVIEGGDVVARVLGGIDWALDQGVRVLSMSLGFQGWWDDFIPIVRILRRQNVLPVIAVGNEGPGTSRSPGNYAEALSVGAVDDRPGVPSFSSSQRFQRTDDPLVPDVVAPGVNVISARPDNRYQSMDGTSMATPHVAGLAALLCEAKPNATIVEIEKAIFSSCNLRGIAAERGNHGIPDAVSALKELTGVNAEAPTGAKRAPQANSRIRRGKTNKAQRKRTRN